MDLSTEGQTLQGRGARIRTIASRERSALGWRALAEILENDRLAADEDVPMCQDTGTAVVLVELGQDVHLTGGLLAEAIPVDVVPCDCLRLTLIPNGGGAENMSRSTMLTPADGEAGARKFIIETVERAGPNACPRLIVGVGIGGTFDTVGLLAKKALARPMGYGGDTTALDVHIETAPCHIVSLPVAVNLQCHATRVARVEL